MPAIQPYVSPAVWPDLWGAIGPAPLPPVRFVPNTPRVTALATDFDEAANRAGELASATPSATPVGHPRHERSPFPGPCNTRYPAAGGFTRQSLSSPQQISAQAHTEFLRANGREAVFGELLEMLRPVSGCPNRRYLTNAELRSELDHRMYCLGIFAYTSVEGMALHYKIPSLMVDGPGYFPGTIAAVFYDIGFQALRHQGVSAQTLEELPSSRVEGAGRHEVRTILMSRPNPRDPYHGFTAYFKPLQFHAHANGMHDAADMLDRITRDDSFGHPVTGPSEAASFLADEGVLLNAHLRWCDRAAEPSGLKRWLHAIIDAFPKL